MHEPLFDDDTPETGSPLDMTWITKDHRVMTLGEMDDNHLRNSTHMIGRALTNLHRELESCWSCMVMFNGDMATYYAEQSADALGEDIHEMTMKHATMLQACRMREIEL